MNEISQSAPPPEAIQAPLGTEGAPIGIDQQIQQQVRDKAAQEDRMKEMGEWSEMQGKIAETAAAPYKDPALNVDDERVSNLDIVASHVDEWGNYPSGKETIIEEKTRGGIGITARVERGGDILVTKVIPPSRVTMVGGKTTENRLRSPKNIATARTEEKELASREPSFIRRVFRRG